MAQMSRRLFLTGAAALTAASLAKPAQGAASAPDTKFVQMIADSPQYLLIGDVDHRRLEQWEFLAQENTLDALAKAGVKHIMLERPLSQQDNIDYFVDGFMTREQYNRETADNVIYTVDDPAHIYGNRMREIEMDLIERATGKGIKIHTVDSDQTFNDPHSEIAQQINLEMDMAVTQAYQDNITKVEAMSPQERDVWLAHVAQDFLTQNVSDSDKKAYLDGIMQQRLSHDKDVAANIQKIAKNDKTVVLYGAQHIDDFAQELGAANTRKIALLPAGEVKELVKDYTPQKGWKIYRLPAPAASPRRGLIDSLFGPASPAP